MAEDSEASGETEGTLTIVCERVTSLEHQFRAVQREVRVLSSRLEALERSSTVADPGNRSLFSFLACCWSRPPSLDNYRS